MKNTLLDLNNHLFAQLERLADEDLTDEQLEHEIKRSKSVVSVAHTIVDNTRVQVDMYRLYNEHKTYADDPNGALPKTFCEVLGVKDEP